MKFSITAVAMAAGASAAAVNAPARIAARASGTSSGSLPTITTKGNAFFAGDNRFYIRGVDYQPGGSSQVTDPLADQSTCERDIKYFQQLGLNTIRVYSVDNTANHDACMSALAEAGIYLCLDVNTPLYSLNRAEVAVSYNADYLQNVFATIDAFAGYSNTLLFFSGNEVVNNANTTNTAPFIKALTRDMKQYIGERGYRSIPVGYSAADVAENQYLMAQYMDCGEQEARGDFYAINNYEWCDPSSYTTSGWDQMVQLYSNYSQPLFMSEYGCNKNTRHFQETGALYQTDMISVFSGGLVYEYSQEASNYGIVTISGNTVTPVGQQFSDLQQALQNNPTPSGDGGYSTSNSQQQCPPQSDNWNTSPFLNGALPAMPVQALSFMKNGAGKGQGLSGSGSQEAGTENVATASAGAGAVATTYSSGSAAATGSIGSQATSSNHTGAASSSRLARSDVAPLVAGAALMASIVFSAALL